MNRDSSIKIKRVNAQSNKNLWSQSHIDISSSAKQHTLFDFKSKNLPNSRLQSQVEWKCLIFETLCCFFTSLNIILIYFLTGEDYRDERSQALSMCSYFTLISVVLYCFKAWNEMKLEKLTEKEMRNTRTSIFVYFFGVCFNILHPCSIAEAWSIEASNFSLRVNDLLCIAMLMKGWILVILAIKCTRFYGSRVARVLEIYAVKNRAGLRYPLKSIFMVHGLRLPFAFLLFSVFLLTVSRMVLGFAEGREVDFITELYDTVISLSTVGYGEINHQSTIERVGMGLFIFLAIFATSLLTLATVNFFTLRDSQLKSLATLKRLQLNERIRKHQKEAIKGIVQGKGKDHNIQGFQRQLSQWRLGYSFMESYKRQLEKLERSIKKLIEKQLLIDGLMDFYLRRGKKEEQEKSVRSRRRVEDSEKLGRLFDTILSMDE